MFLTPEELLSAIQDYQLADITGEPIDGGIARSAILAAIEEATGYLNAKYDCQAIFSAEGNNRNVLLLEHCKSIAVWYILRRGNTDIIFDRAKEYRKAAIDWLTKVSGTDPNLGTIAPDLPLKKVDGQVQTRFRYGSGKKFTHDYGA